MRPFKIAFLGTFIILACNGPEPRKPVVRKTSSLDAESVEINRTINALEETELLDYAVRDSAYVYESSSKGFWYAITKSGNTEKTVAVGDQVLFETEIADLSNNIIYRADEIGLQSYIVDKENIVEGLRDGLKLLHEGAEATFLFPSHKVFGFSGNNDRIENNQPLVYYIKIIKINKNESN